MMASIQESTNPVTPAMEDYLKSIYLLQQETGNVTTSLLGEKLGGVRPSSVTGMLKRLAETQLVAYAPYQGVTLTERGEKTALIVIRHHRLLELYLVEALGYSWDEVHDEADRLEHHISPKMAARISEHLGNPTVDPHGDPIPTPEGTLPTTTDECLCELEVGAVGRIVRVRKQSAERLRYLAELGLIPGSEVEMLHITPFEGPITVRVCGTEQTLDYRMAQHILVVRISHP